MSEAMDRYHAALRLQPEFPEAHYNIGNAWKEQGETERAVASWKEELRCKPDFAERTTISASHCVNRDGSMRPWPGIGKR